MNDRKPLLIDVTRLIARNWTGRHSTGIDRVCEAYLRHYRQEALAVVQHRGVVRVLSAHHSGALFDLLLEPPRGFKRALSALAPAALMSACAEADLARSIYLNASHTDFDLGAHFDWVRRAGVTPFYFIHDLIPILHPEFTSAHAVKRHVGRVRSVLRNGARIITSSRSVAADIRRFAAQESLAEPEIVSSWIAGEYLDCSGDKGQEQTRARFLCLGTIEPRKNHALLLEVWRQLVQHMGSSAPELIIVGQDGPLSEDILAPVAAEPMLASHIRWFRDCSDDEVGQWLAKSTALLIPSLAEGFGLPVVESLAAGVPVLASDLPVFAEITQGHAQLLAADNVEIWAAAIAKMAQNRAKNTSATTFKAPEWEEHFLDVNAAIEVARLQAGPVCESTLAA